MIRIFRTTDGSVQQIHQTDDHVRPERNSWVALTDPSPDELELIASVHHIDIDDLKTALDEEERSRLVVEEGYTMIVQDIPVTEIRNGKEYFYTIPFAIIRTEDAVITVCLEDTSILTVFMDGRVRDFETDAPVRFIFQMLYRNASMYLQYLRIIDKKSDEVEKKLHISQRNQELIDMLELEKSLVYITTSLRGNELVLERLLKNESIPRNDREKELLDDVIIENKQAIEMAKIYSDILSGTMDAYASVISNNLNIVMKFLAVITIVLTIPTIVTGAFGMNFDRIPLAHHPYGFWIILGISLLLALVAGWLIGRYQKLK